MNKFDQFFFSKYVPEGETMSAVYHRHPLVIIDDVAVWLFFGVLLPTLFYLHNSFSLATWVPLPFFEGFLALVWAALMWRVFDWYNDVWIVTDRSVIDLDWTPTKQNVVTLAFHNIEGIETKEKTIIDNLVGRGDVIIHCLGTQFVLDNALAPEKVVSQVREATEAYHSASHQAPNADFGTGSPAANQETEFTLLVDALKDIVRERMDSKRVEREEKEKIRPALEAALARPGTIDLRPDHEKWEREPAGWNAPMTPPSSSSTSTPLPEWATAQPGEPLPEPPPEQTSFPSPI